MALLSKHSLTKQKPLKERTLAQEVGAHHEISDFLITLNLDGTQPDWTLSDISSISFEDGWADGLRRVLKKLKSIDTPQIHHDNPSIARTELLRGEEVLSDEREDLVTNWMPFTDLPSLLTVYDAIRVENKNLVKWPSARIGKNKLISLFPPPQELDEKVKQTVESYLWKDNDKIYHSPTHNLIVQILNRAVSYWFKQAGCISCLKGWESYLPETLEGKSRLKFHDLDGKERHIKHSGKITFKVPTGPPEKITYHNSVRHKIRKLDSGLYAIELIPSIVLFDSKRKPIGGRKVNARRKKVTTNWYNDKWRVRMLAFAQLLKSSPAVNNECFLGNPMVLNADKSIKESALNNLEEATEPETIESTEIIIGQEEMEGWKI